MPAIVLGIHDNNVQDLLDNIKAHGHQYIAENIDPNSISIIDGMQRTTALKEAGDSIGEEKVRNWILDYQ